MKIFSCLLLFWSVSMSTAFSETYTSVININNNSRSGGSNCTRGNGQITRETRELGNFREIDIVGAFTVFIRCGNTHEATLRVDSNVIPLIKTAVSGNILRLENTTSICVDHPIEVFLTTDTIERVNTEGSNDITVECETYDTLSLTLGGASELGLTGSGKSLTAVLEDATELHAGKSVFQSAQVTTNSAATAIVVAEQSLIAKSSDASEIYYNDSVLHIQKTISEASEILPLSEK